MLEGDDLRDSPAEREAEEVDLVVAEGADEGNGIGGHLVDVSPLSTLGALCVAAVPDGAAAAQLFRRLLIWGLSMSLAGAILCQLLAGPLARL